MNLSRIFIISVFALMMAFIPVSQSRAGAVVELFDYGSTDTSASLARSLFYFFDLRDRETFIQLTLESQGSGNMHIQIFDVANNCNENNFFDVYTPNDTHIYNMRDIQTNDGNPSGVVLPDGAYGFVVITTTPFSPPQFPVGLIGNMRIIDNNGYEYRTNAVFNFENDLNTSPEPTNFYTFNFNQEAGVSFSDIVGITVFSSDLGFTVQYLADPLSAFNTFDIDIVDNNEVLFSCRDIIFSCVNQESVLLESLLEIAGTANVASFEYGINNVIPHSKGGELLCPGNVVGEGAVILRPELQPSTGNSRTFVGYVGLNNGNGRGSFDSLWTSFRQFFN